MAPPTAAQAFAAMQLVAHWGNRKLPAPAPRAEVVAAAVLVVGPSEEGVEQRAAEHAWLAAVAAACRVSSYAGMLVAEVGAQMNRPSHDALAEALTGRARRLGEQLALVPRYAQLLAGDGHRRNCRCLEACLGLAGGLLDEVQQMALVGPTHAGDVDLTATRVDSGRYRLRPWPCVGSRLRLVVEQPPGGDSGAIVVRTVVLQRCSAPSA